MQIRINYYDAVWPAFSTYVPILYKQEIKPKPRRVERVNESESPNNARDCTKRNMTGVDLLV